MAIKRVWLGSVGPFLYDDAGTYEDGVLNRALRTEGQLQIDSEPIVDKNALRLMDIDYVVGIVEVDDIDDPSPELATKRALRDGALIVVYEAGTPNDYALYAYDFTAGGEDIPTICAGTVGYWVCIVGVHAIGGHGSADKQIRVSRITISDSGVSDNIDCLGTNIYNGYSIAEATSIAKGGSEGYFDLSADGATLGIADGAFPGGLIAILGIPSIANTSGDALFIQAEFVLGAMYLTFRRADSSKVDLTQAVNVGVIAVDISFLTTS